jgi:glycosyltransferase involved in cell wall biosynthesis
MTKFSIVTPTYNMERWIEETIESVLSQKGDFEIEYIVVSDGSSDQSAAIARTYQERLRSGTHSIQCKKIDMQIIEQENTGMYAAINNGFSKATGDVYAWINADDLYQQGALEAMRIAFEAFPEAQWVKGTSAAFEDGTKKFDPEACKIYHHDWLKMGVYGMESYFVTQDSVFWREDLWKKGGPIPVEYRSAGDYWLWLSFAKHAPLWILDAPISCFRKREGQISKGIEKYKKEQWYARGKRPLGAWIPRLFFYPYFHFSQFERIMEHFYPILFPHKKRVYIALNHGKATLRTMPSFTIRNENT